MILNNYKKTKTNELIIYLFDLIESKKIQANELMPSELFLCNKFKCSRSIVILAYSKLEAIGAVYVAEKRGRYAVAHFSNLIKPLSYTLNSDSDHTEKIPFHIPAWFNDFNIEPIDRFNCYLKKYYKDSKLIMEAKYYLTNSLDLPDSFDEISITHKFAYENFILEKIQYILRYENIEMFGYHKIVVVYMLGYYKNKISMCAQYLIHPDDFVFRHDEYNLIS